MSGRFIFWPPSFSMGNASFVHRSNLACFAWYSNGKETACVLERKARLKNRLSNVS